MSGEDGPLDERDRPPRPGQIPRTDTAAPVDPDATHELGGPVAPEADGRAEEPRSIGPYRLLRRIGEGGMGQVWLALQTAPLRRQVALKLIRAGLYDDSVIQRFQSERQSLAIMDHPAIARVFDAGTTPDGQPYFVMEYVDGTPITAYCDDRRLTVRDRLALMVQVCEGVQHAHQKAVIHRDLKPANILVAEVDGRPAPRIIDFGLARAISPQAAGDPELTRAGGSVGTPGYMSPEQADPGGRDVDTRADVYSLGVVLYVLLAGTTPFDMASWRDQPIDVVLRRLREDDAPPPSSRAARDRDGLATAAGRRRTEPRALVSMLKGDLDAIVMKAIDRDRSRRYGSPSDLAADIGRYQRNEPVVARPAGALYRLRKLARRHRAGVAVAAGLVVLLVAFIAVQASQLRRITRERDRANRVTEFMTRMFRVADPDEARGNKVTAREILDKAAEDIDTGLSGDPLLQARMLDVMGTVYGNLGLYERSRTILEKAVEIHRAHDGPASPETLASMIKLGNTLSGQGRLDEAESLYREVLAVRRRVLGPDHLDTARVLVNLAAVLDDRGRPAEAEVADREALAILLRDLGPGHPHVLTLQSNLAIVLGEQGHYEEAVRLDREVLETRRRVLGPEHGDTLASITNLTLALMHKGGHDAEVEALLRESVETYRRIHGPEHPETLMAATALASALIGLDRNAEAESLERETLAIKRRVLGPEHADTLDSMTNLATAILQQRRGAEAEALLRETIDVQRRVLGPDSMATLRSMINLAAILQNDGRLADAERLVRETIGLEVGSLGTDHTYTMASMFNLANILWLQGRYTEAEPAFREVRDIHVRVHGPADARTVAATHALGRCAARAGRRDEALALLREAVDHGLAANAVSEMETDPAFEPLRGDPRFTALVEQARASVAAAKQGG